MKPIYYIASIIISGFLMFSCEKVVDFTGQLPPNKLVLNCFVTPDSFVTATVSRSWNLSQSGWNTLMKDAAVNLYINGEFKEAMHLTDSMDYFFSHVSTIKAKEGDIVKLEVKKSDYPDIESEALIPGKAKIISIDTLSFQGQYNYNGMRCFIKFKDLDGGRRNHYRLIVERFTVMNDTIVGSNGVYYEYDLDPALQEGFASVTDETITTGTENIYGIFSDDSFDGQEYTLNISFNKNSYWYYSGGETEKQQERYRFKLITLSESAYLYLKSRTYYDYNGDGDPFTEPSIIYNNIRNGLGIMGAFQTDTMTITMPLVEDGIYN